MTTDEENDILKKIEIAIQNFPKVLERQRKAAAHKQEMMRRFEPLSQMLLKMMQEKEEQEKLNRE